MQYQLPPHGFWIKQTGGMSVLDILMLVIVLLLNLMWFCVGMKNFNDEHAASECCLLTGHEVFMRGRRWCPRRRHSQWGPPCHTDTHAQLPHALCASEAGRYQDGGGGLAAQARVVSALCSP